MPWSRHSISKGKRTKNSQGQTALEKQTSQQGGLSRRCRCPNQYGLPGSRRKDKACRGIGLGGTRKEQPLHGPLNPVSPILHPPRLLGYRNIHIKNFLTL